MRRKGGYLGLAEGDFGAPKSKYVVRAHRDARFGQLEICSLHRDKSVLQSGVGVGPDRRDILLRHVRPEIFRSAGNISIGGNAIGLRSARLHKTPSVDSIVHAEVVPRLKLVRPDWNRATLDEDFTA